MDQVRAMLTFGLSGLLLIVGCGPPSDQPELAYCEGYVTMDDAPLPGVLVLFAPDEGRTSFGYTDEDGYFELMYLSDTPGAVIGTHKVSIATDHEEEEEPETRADRFVDPIPARYNTDTTLTAEVVADTSNEFKFELESK